MKKLVSILLISLITLSACAAEDGATEEDEKTEEVAFEVSVQNLKAGEIAYSEQYIGTVRAEDDVRIISSASGTVGEVKIKTGDEIEKNTVVIELLDGEGKRESVQVNYDIAKATYDNAKDNVIKVKSISKESEKAAKSNVDQVQISIDNLRKQINDTNTTTASTKEGLQIAVDTAKLSVDNLNETIQKTINTNSQQLAISDTSVSIASKSLDVAKDNERNSQESVEQTIEQAELALDNLRETLDYLEDNQTVPPNPEIETQIFQTKLQIDAQKEVIEAAELQEESTEDSTENTVDLQQLQLQSAQQQNAQLQSALDLQLTNLYQQLSLAEKQYQSALQNLDSVNIQNEVQINGIENQIAGLNEQKSFAQTNLEQTKIANAQQIAQAELQLKQAELNMEQAELQLDDYTITAPISGVVEEVFVTTGDEISPGMEIAHIIQPDNYVVVVNVPWKEANKIDISKPVDVGLNGETFEGTVDITSVTVNKSTQTVAYEILADIDYGTQFINKMVDVTMQFKLQNNEETIYIPLSSVNIGNEQMSVFVIGEDNKVTETFITTGDVIGSNIEVLEGLTVGQNIIIDGQRSVRDGQIVALKDTNTEE